MSTEDDTRRIVARLRDLRAEAGRGHLPFEIQVSPIDAFDADGYRRLSDLGVTDVIVQPWLLFGAGLQASAEEKRDGIKRFAEEVMPRVKA
jgi:hypothetical protein